MGLGFIGLLGFRASFKGDYNKGSFKGVYKGFGVKGFGFRLQDFGVLGFSVQGLRFRGLGSFATQGNR